MKITIGGVIGGLTLAGMIGGDLFAVGFKMETPADAQTLLTCRRTGADTLAMLNLVDVCDDLGVRR